MTLNQGAVFGAGIRILKKSDTEALTASSGPAAYLHFVRESDGSTIVPEYEPGGLATYAGPLPGAKITIPETDLSALEATAPTAGQKAALAGTSGTPSGSNKYVTDGDARNTNARAPTSHATTHIGGGSDAIPLAVSGGAAGLLSGTLAALLAGATNLATALALVVRDAAGRFKAADPAASDDVATKGYADTAIESATTDLATLAVTNGRTMSRNAAGNTYGNCVMARKNCTATAIRFAHSSLGAAETIKVSLWDAQTGLRMTSENVSVSSSGTVEVTLTSPQALTVGKVYKVTAFNSTNSVNVTLNPGFFDNLTVSTVFLASPCLMRTTGVNVAGDNNPTTLSGLFPVHLVAG